MPGTNESDPTGETPDLGITDPTVRSPEPPGLPAPTKGITDPTVKAASPPAITSPLNPDGSPVGAGTPWDPKTSAPVSAPPGYHWDPKLAMFQPDGPATTGGGSRPTIGNDPGLTAYLQGWAAAHPGANPSVARDPGYWASRMAQTHGANAIDWGYWEGRMMTPEGPPEAAGGGPGGVRGTGPAPGQGNGTTFEDPAYQALNALAQARIASLQGPQSFPQLDALMQQLQAQQGVNKQRAADLASKWGSRVTELQQPLLTTPQVVQQRAMAENPLLASRDAALANAKARQSARGFAPTSGLANDEARQINENASNQQGQIDARLEQGNIGTDEARRNEATQLQGLITQALNGGDATALQEQAQTADLENQLYQTDQNRQTQQLATAQIPVDLTNTGFSNARSAISDPASAFSSLMPLIMAAITGQKNTFDQSNSQSSGLSQLISTILGNWK